MNEPEVTVDITLIEEMLELTPEQRLLRNESLMRALVELRRSAGVFDDRFDEPE
jgi:hypothetical protein